MPIARRACLALAAAAALPRLPQAAGGAAGAEPALAALRRGGVVVAFRHALAPGTFDPPGFRLGDCGSQRNLDDEGRAQARRLGEFFRRQGLVPARVRSSPWCRCLDTATLAFGRAEAWSELGSPTGRDESTRAEQVQALRAAVAEVARAGSGFEAWVTHQFVLNALGTPGFASAEGVVFSAAADGSLRELGRLPPP